MQNQEQIACETSLHGRGSVLVFRSNEAEAELRATTKHGGAREEEEKVQDAEEDEETATGRDNSCFT